MSEQYGCPDCNYVANIEDLPIQCPICGHTSMEHLRWTKGGAGSHWDGCVDVHWDCRIAQLEAENSRLTAELEQEKDNCGKFFLALEEIYDTLGMDDHTGGCIPEIEKLQTKNDDLTAENERLSQMLHDELSQLEIATDLGNKRWLALNEIYENGEKHNANWCKRKAQEGLGIK